MTLARRLVVTALWLVGVLFVAGVVHIVSVLALPVVAPEDAFDRLARIAPVGTLSLLPAATPRREIAPFEDPAMAEGLCLYDLSEAPLRLRTSVDEDRLMTLSFRTRGDSIFYAMTDRAAVRGKIDILVVTATQLEEIEANDDEDNPPQELRLVSPTPIGFVLIKALVGYSGDRAAAEARIKALSCSAEPLGQN